VIYSKYSSRAITLLALLPLMLTAQKAHESVVPLKNWASPLYWQPNQAESVAAAKALRKDDGPPAPVPTFLTFVAMTPCRLVDTRGAADDFNGIQPFVGPSIPGGTMVTFPVQSLTEAAANNSPAPCGVIPSIAEAYSFNLTVIPQGGAAVGYVTLWPAGVAQPFVATLNDSQGLVVDNAAIVPAGLASLVNPAGSVSLYNSGPAIIDVVIDMNGYFTSPTDLNGNTALGAGTLVSNTGNNNTATGDDALQNNTGGSSNTANGYQALQTNAGSQNTAIGSLALANNATGNDNTATGFQALNTNSGSYNTADGAQTLSNNTSGSLNTAIGFGVLAMNTQGIGNTASGYQAMASNLGGNSNTATGVSALQVNTFGSFNTATGGQALQSNTGGYNTAIGYQALTTNTVGANNTASGYQALMSNTIGANNTASGYNALASNTGGGYNTASGYNALASNTSGGNNTAIGESALSANTGGANNIAIGYLAGVSQPPGNNDSIYLGSAGSPIDAPGSIQIGTQSGETYGRITIGAAQTGGTSIAGVYGGTPNAVNLPVCVDSNGILGTTACTVTPCPFPCAALRTPSSLRFKDQIADMGGSSDKLLQLRPVTFLYKPEYDDGSHALQYGLIAEEVAKLYPEMVGYDKAGQPSSVNYQSLAPMLLNELQKQAEQVRSLEERLSALEAGLPNGLGAPEPVR
jgi:hypothetical protein